MQAPSVSGSGPPAVGHEDLVLPAVDGFALAATRFGSLSSDRIVVINSATAVKRRFYTAFAQALAARGYLVLTYDYRGIGGSRPASLKGFEARARDWGLLDMQGVVNWAAARQPERLLLVGHSIGGQMVGMLDDPSVIHGMVTMSAQSGHWRLQGGSEKFSSLFHMYVTLPGLSHLYGYMPWSLVASGEDLPKGVALEWAAWCRNRAYLLGDSSLPLERYGQFTAPVLAYSFDDDDWGTERSVRTMMAAYPHVVHRHVRHADVGLAAIGHFGFFRRPSHVLWEDAFDWLDGCGREA